MKQYAKVKVTKRSNTTSLHFRKAVNIPSEVSKSDTPSSTYSGILNALEEAHKNPLSETSARLLKILSLVSG